MTHGFSKKNQSPAETAYRFADFELHPTDRLLKKSGTPVPLQPKAFDALLCLVRRAKHLVSKQELTLTLWPDIHVSEANLTNTIVSLRKIVGREAITTASKHGYRFELPVEGEPGVPSATYEKFLRAKELTTQRSVACMLLARDLYWTCLAEDPTFASAWAWLGRCCWFLAKFNTEPGTNLDLAQAAFNRAFAIDPDLASAHQFYTFVEVDTGRAAEAMPRILDRLNRHPGEPESFTSLVQVFRFADFSRNPSKPTAAPPSSILLSTPASPIPTSSPATTPPPSKPTTAAPPTISTPPPGLPWGIGSGRLPFCVTG